MPRPITVYPADIVGLRRNVTDVIHDYEQICSYYRELLEEELSDEGYINLSNHITRCRSEMSDPVHRNRVYITTNLIHISLMMVDTDDGVIDHLKYALDLICPEFDDISDKDLEFLYPSLWIFEGTTLTFRSIISPKTLGTLMVVFDKDNLVDFNSSRYDWKTRRRTAKPRSTDKFAPEANE